MPRGGTTLDEKGTRERYNVPSLAWLRSSRLGAHSPLVSRTRGPPEAPLIVAPIKGKHG
jgi:hypothetical protein